jgi:hypothetical protein
VPHTWDTDPGVFHLAMRIAAGLLVLVVATSVGGCGQPTAPAAPTVKVNPTALTAAGSSPSRADSCQASQLKITRQAIDESLGTATNRLIFTNISHRVCTLQGYPRITSVGGEGNAPDAPLTPGAAGPLVTLQPGQQASAFYTAELIGPPPCRRPLHVTADAPHMPLVPDTSIVIEPATPNDPLWFCNYRAHAIVPGALASYASG